MAVSGNENKTRATGASVAAFIAALENDTRRADAKLLVKLFSRITGERAKLWGPSIIGFGTRHYRYESGREGDVPIAGFSPRKANLVFYLAQCPRRTALLKRLGKHRTGVGCVYVNKLADIDMAVFEDLLTQSVAHARSAPETAGC